MVGKKDVNKEVPVKTKTIPSLIWNNYKLNERNNISREWEYFKVLIRY